MLKHYGEHLYQILSVNNSQISLIRSPQEQSFYFELSVVPIKGGLSLINNP